MRLSRLGKNTGHRPKELCEKVSESLKKSLKNRRYLYTLISPDKTIYQDIMSLKELCEENNLSYNRVRWVTRKESREFTYKGWIISFKNKEEVCV